MKYLKLYEDFKKHFVGIHCSPRIVDGEFDGRIIDEYHSLFQHVLSLIQYDYKEAKTYLQQIELLHDGLYMEDETAVDLIFEIESFFSDNNIEWIFVSNGDPLTKYGDNCYNVYFNDLNNIYSMQDELVENATIYIYTENNKPILDESY